MGTIELFHTGIISSRYHQSSYIFHGYGQGLQCIANCVLSLIYNQHKNYKYWTQFDLTNILTSGNILYNSTGKKTTILVSDLPKYIKLYDYIYYIEESMSLIGNIFVENITFHSLPFHKIENVIVKYKYCILVLGESAISITYTENSFFTFDPHSRDTCGFPDPNGTAKVLKFNNFTKLCSFIYKLSKYLQTENYELTPITITKYKQMNSSQKINNTTFNENKKPQNFNFKTAVSDNKNKYQFNNKILTNKEISECSKKIETFTEDFNTNNKTSDIQQNNINKRKSDFLTTNTQNKKFKNDIEYTKNIKETNKRKYENKETKTSKKLRTDSSLLHEFQKPPNYINTYKNKTVKNVQIRLIDIIHSIHKQKNKKTLLKAKKDNELCKQHGHKLNILIVKINNITKYNKETMTNKEKIPNYIKQKYGSDFKDSIKIFNKLTSQGPIFVCSLCQQTTFSDKVTKINKLHQTKNSHLLHECRTYYKSINNEEYICNTCRQYIYKGKIPRLSIKNGCNFPDKPQELDLFNLEERFISPVMAFMLIHQLLPGGQLSLYGSICHLPIEIGKVIKVLPRTFDQYETISVKLKRRLCYKNTVFNENIRPLKIVNALHYLLHNSELYKKHNIDINPEWLENFSKTNNTSQKNAPNQSQSHETKNNTDDNSDEDDENEELPNAPSVNTLLTENTIDPNKNILCIAPAEGQKPIFTDEDTEYLCFPTIFCGKTRNQNKYYNLSKREIFKYEMRSVDKRVSTNIPNIFWKTKYKQINQIRQQVSFALRRNQSKGNKITVKTLLNKETRQQIMKYDDGYKIFKNIRSSPPYFEHKKKDLMAMIRQLGIPTLFISLSAADTKWTELLQSIYLLIHKKNITHNELENMSWSEKCQLISKDPGTCARYFSNRVQKFFKHILKSPHSPLGILANSFYRVEFQHRGSPHIHSLLWIKNAPHYEKNTDTEITTYIDSIISCSSSNQENKYTELQIHKHSKTCIRKINNTKKCRFGAPWPPLNKTQVLYPLDESHIHEKEKYSKTYNNINKFIQMQYKKKEFIDFNQMLQELNITYELYILALRSTIKKRRIFLKRSLREIFINNYMPHLIDVWKANHDIQYVLDPYSCVVYICDYLMKNNKGMSKLLENAAKEAKQGNMDLKQSVRHIGNKFLNCTEMSEQECAYSLLELPITQSSIKVEFINTSEINNRVFIAKPDHILQTMDPESEEIKQENNIDKYASRPSILKEMCLADYVSLTDIVYCHKQIQSDDEMSIHENTSDEENTDTNTDTKNTNNLHTLFPIKIKNNKMLKLRKHRKVIRFVNYKYKIDPENYCREKLLLYIPWKNNELEILQKFKTYIDAYNHFQKQIHNKMKIFEPAAHIIEHALIEYEEHPDKFLPNSNSTIEDNINNIPPEIDIIDEQFQFLIPNNNNSNTKYDLHQDLKITKYNYVDSVQTKPNILDNTEFIDLINSLNTKQYKFFLYIMQQQLHNENNQTLVCLHGGAGTGKSHVLKAVYQGLNKLLNQKPGQSTDDITTLLIAPTGKAAYNIKGHTIHAAFHVPANQSLVNYTKLSWDNLNTYRSKYLNLKWIICDEISMVSNYMLKFIHLRLQEIKSNNSLFGGLNIIAVGDLYQLKPVMGQFIFENYRTNYGPLATNLWAENFKIYELTEIMRQKDDQKFAELLNRLRTGHQTKEDITLLKNTKVANKQLQNNSSIPHFYPTLEQVHLHNQKVTQNQKNFIIESKSTDILPSSISKFLEISINAAISKRKINHTGGLPESIILITNQQYDLISNIDVDDGLINGTQCIIKFIQTTQRNNKKNELIPYIVWVEFENTDTAKNHRHKYSYLYTNNKISREWTPLVKIKRSFIVKDHWIHRVQFPLRQAAARTIHVSQSSTYKQIYVDLQTFSKPPTTFWEHMHYVAFSRVTSISGLYIENINETNICTSKKVSDYLTNALQNDQLQTDIEFKNKTTLNILFNNCRSFKKYFKTLQNNKIIDT